MDLAKYLQKYHHWSVKDEEAVQSLWSGYGQIIRVQLINGPAKSIIVKHINIQTDKKHPRGWATDLSHQRKLKSYQIERHWYQHYAAKTNDQCRVPQWIACHDFGSETFLLLEDLDAAQFEKRGRMGQWNQIFSALKWLAHFHAQFLNHSTEGLWKNGTYWHLQTRPDELKALNDLKLKSAANSIDQKLNACKYQTIVHGDAKMDNFCFNSEGDQAAAVDFQYVGKGCGIKDVAYFIGSCLSEEECENHETELLNYYFNELKNSLLDHSVDREELEEQWRELFYWAWADFHRFLKGWSPGHWKINSYSEKICAQIIEQCRKSSNGNKYPPR